MFKYVDEGKLSSSQIDSLVKQLESIDVVRVNQVYQDAIKFEQDIKAGICNEEKLEPLPQECCGNVSAMSHQEETRYRGRGFNAIQEGEVAALVLAGGAGTRLGFDSPKGSSP